MASHGMPLGWFEVLVQLTSAPDSRLKMQELAHSVLLSKSGVTRLVDRMEAAGLVTRAACPTDRRAVYAVVTPAGTRGAPRRTPPAPGKPRRTVHEQPHARRAEHASDDAAEGARRARLRTVVSQRGTADVSGRAARDAGRLGPSRPSDRPGSTSPRVTRSSRAADPRRIADMGTRTCPWTVKWSPILVGSPPARLRSISNASARTSRDRVEHARAIVFGHARERRRRVTPARGAARRRSSRGRCRRRCAGRGGSCGGDACRPRCSASAANASESGSGPSFCSGPSSPGASTHQPALRSVPNSFTSTEGRSANRNRTTDPLGFVCFGGSSTSMRPPWERWTSSLGPPNSKTRYLPRRPTRSSVTPPSDSGAGTTVFSAENCSGTAPANAEPPTAAVSRSASACTSGSSGMTPLYRSPR